MAIHVELSEEAKIKQKKDLIRSNVITLTSSILAIALIGLTLGLISQIIPTEEPDVIISYSISNDQDSDQSSEQKPQTQQRSVPAAQPSTSMASVITSSAPSAVSIPSIDTTDLMESSDFGDFDDFGGGFEADTNFESTSFFGSTISGERICYVIDYSLSMKQKDRVRLMKKELASSVKKLQDGPEYCLIFFAGPVWQSSDQLVFEPGTAKLLKTVQEDGEEVDWTLSERGIKQELKKLKPKWVKPNEGNIKKSLQEIANTELVLGTHWKKPLDVALSLSPTPDTIVFMTDGDGGDKKIVREIARTANKKSITINTISLMQPKATEHIAKLSELTGGSSVIVHADGSSEDLLAEK